MVSRIGAAVLEVSPTFPGFQRAARTEAGKLQGTFTESGRTSGGVFAGALKKAVVGGAVVAGTAAGAGLGYALTRGFQRLSAIETAQAKLRGIGRTSAEVKTIMTGALESVKGTSFGMDQAATAAAGAVAAGIKPGGELNGVLKSMANSAAAAGIRMDEMGGIYNKVASTGKAQNDVLQQVADRGVPIYKALADQLGVTQDEVFKMASQGKVNFKTFETAMASASGTVAKEMGTTTTGTLQNLDAAMSRLGAGLLAGVFPKIQPLIASLIGVVDRLTVAAGPLSDVLGKALGGAIGGLSTWLDSLDFTGISAATLSIGGLRTGIDNAAAAAGPLGPIMRAAGAAIAWMAQNSDLVVKALPYVIAGLVAWRLATLAASAAVFKLRVAEAAMAPVFLANQMLRTVNIVLERQMAAASNASAVAKARETAAVGANTGALTGNRVATMAAGSATRWHSLVTGASARAFLVQRVATVQATVAMVAHRVAMMATTVATSAAAVATRALNLALRAGPWMLVVAAIAGIAYGLTQFFTKTDEGRAIWTKFTADLATAFAPVRTEFARMQPLLGQLMAVFGQLAGTVVGALGSVLGQIMPVFASLVGTLATGLVPIISTLATTFATTLLPVISTLASTLLPVLAQIFGVVATVLTAVLSAVMPIVTALVSLLVPVIQVVLTILTLLVQILAAILVPVIRVVATVLTWLATIISTIVQVAFNVLSTVFNAVALFVTTYLVPAFTWLGQVFALVFAGIQAAIQLWWNVVVLPIFNAVVGFVQTVLVPAFQFIGQVFALVFAGIQAAIQLWWNVVVLPIFNAVVGFVRNTLAPAFTWLWNNVITPVWKGIRDAISAAWTSIKTNVFDPIVNFVRNTLAPAFTAFKDTATTVWSTIQTSLATTWSTIKTNIFNPLRDAVTKTLPKAFEAGKDAIGKAWDKVRDVAKKPVKFVIDTIINNGIIGGFNKIAEQFKVKKIPQFPTPKGFRIGGPVRGPGTGTSDSIPAMLSNNEHVWTDREVRGAGGHGTMYKLRDLARRGMLGARGFLPALAGGGTLMDAADWFIAKGARAGRHSRWNGGRRITSGHSKGSMHYQDKAVDLNFAAGTSAFEQGKFDKYLPEFKRLFPKIRTIWRAPGHFDHLHIDTSGGADIGKSSGGGGGGPALDLSFFTKPFEALKSKVAGGVAGAGAFSDLVGGGAKQMIDAPITWIKNNMSLVADAVEGAVDTAVSGAVQTMVQSVAAMYGWGGGSEWAALKWIVNKESSWNPKAANPTSSARGLFQKMTSIHGPLEKTIPGQAKWGLDYIKKTYGTPTKAMAFHKSRGWYADGGPVRPQTPTLYDNGGWLQPGLTTVLNATGKPEAVFTDTQLDTMNAAGEAGRRGAPTVENLYALDIDEAIRKLYDREQQDRAHYAGTGVLV